jgi:hypothetical protein
MNARRAKEYCGVLHTRSSQLGLGFKVFGQDSQRARISAFQEAKIAIGKWWYLRG